MLGKLLKYELQAIQKKICPFYIAFFALAIFFSVFLNITYTTLEDLSEKPIAFFLFVFIFYALIIALSVVTIITIVNRFRKSLLGKEGYLMFTLPVSVNTHLISKILSSTILCICNSIVIIVSFWLILGTQLEIREYFFVGFTFEDIKYIWCNFTEFMGFSAVHLIILYLIGIIGYMGYFLLTIYFSLAIGHTSKRNKFVLSFLVYIGINMALGTILQILLISFVLFAQDLTQQVILDSILPAMYLTCGVLILLDIGFYFGTWAILKKKLNLE